MHFSNETTLYNVCSVHRGDTMSTSGEYHEDIRGCSVHLGDIIMHVEEEGDKSLSVDIENPNVLNMPRCTHHVPPPNSQKQFF